MQNIFLSHSKKDKEFVHLLNASFLAIEVKTFLDEKDILVGQSIPEGVYRGIDEATHLIYVISENSVNSKWVAEELNIAKMKEKMTEGFTILPVILDSVTLPTSITHIKYANFKEWRNPDAFRKAFLSVLRALDISPKTIGEEELRWYAANSSELKECLYWLTKSAWEVNGGLTAGQAESNTAHYMPTKFAFEYNGVSGDLKKIISLIPDNASVNGRLITLAKHAKSTLEFIDMKLNCRKHYNNRDNVDLFVKKLTNLLQMIEQLRNETEIILLSSFDAAR